MNFFLFLYAVAGMVASFAAGDSDCPVHLVGYDKAPHSYKDGHFRTKNVDYSGFQVARASNHNTYFSPISRPNMLSLSNGQRAVIRPAQGSTIYPRRFHIGCSRQVKGNDAEPVNCQVEMATPVKGYGGPETVSIFLDKSGYSGRHLRLAEWGGPKTPYINVSLFDTAEHTTLYIDNLHYQIDCDTV